MNNPRSEIKTRNVKGAKLPRLVIRWVSGVITYAQFSNMDDALKQLDMLRHAINGGEAAIIYSVSQKNKSPVLLNTPNIESIEIERV